MQTSHKINFEAVTLKNQRIISQKENFIELFPDRLEVKYDFLAEEWKDDNDHSLGSEEFENYFLISATKEAVSGFEFCKVYDPKRWRIIISVNGFTHDIRLFFKLKDEEKAKEVFNTLKLWRYEW